MECWDEHVWIEEKARDALRLSLRDKVAPLHYIRHADSAQDSLERLDDMDIMIQPSFTVGITPYYLYHDLEVFAKLVGADRLVKPTDIFTNAWRKALMTALRQAGMDYNVRTPFRCNGLCSSSFVAR